MRSIWVAARAVPGRAWWRAFAAGMLVLAGGLGASAAVPPGGAAPIAVGAGASASSAGASVSPGAPGSPGASGSSGLAASPIDRAAALAASQAAVGRLVRDQRFTDRRGGHVRLSDFRGRPVVVSFIYTSCAHTCPMLTRHLEGIVQVAREALGKDSFTMLTIGFDTVNDTPLRMASFARQNGIDLADWKFLSADRATITALTQDLGFAYAPSVKGFDHLTQTTVIDADGRVFSQVYGGDFEAPLLVEPLKALVFGTKTPFASLDDLVQRIHLFCTIYNPASGRYRFDYSLFIGLATGIVILGGVGFMLIRGWWRIRRTGNTAS